MHRESSYSKIFNDQFNTEAAEGIKKKSKYQFRKVSNTDDKNFLMSQLYDQHYFVDSHLILCGTGICSSF